MCWQCSDPFSLLFAICPNLEYSVPRGAWYPVQSCAQPPQVLGDFIQPVWSQCGLGITVWGCWERVFAWVRKALHVKWWGKLLWNENQCSFTNPGRGSLQKTQCHNLVSLGWCLHLVQKSEWMYLNLRKSATCKGLIPPPRGFFLFGQTPTDGGTSGALH